MDYQALIEMAALAGEIMLRSGAEVYRVEDTVSRILKKSGLKGEEVFVLSTGIFLTLSDPKIKTLSVVRRVRDHSTNLSHIYEVNNISRAFCNSDMKLEEAQKALEEILHKKTYSSSVKCLGYVMVAAFFAVMFDGGLLEGIAAAIVGAILFTALTVCSRVHLNDFCQNAAGSFVLGIAAYLIQSFLFPKLNLDVVIIGAIMPIVPGVTFTSAIRDILNGDYSSGVARIAQSVVVALAIAFGVGIAMIFVTIL